MTSLTSPTEFQKKMEEWRKHTPAQRERVLRSLATAHKQAVWNLQQIEREMQAIRAMNNNNPSATNRFAVLAAINDDDDGVNEDEMDRIDAASDGVNEDEMDEDDAECEDVDDGDDGVDEDEMDELIAEVREDEQRAQGPQPPPPGTHYVNGDHFNLLIIEELRAHQHKLKALRRVNIKQHRQYSSHKKTSLMKHTVHHQQS